MRPHQIRVRSSCFSWRLGFNRQGRRRPQGTRETQGNWKLVALNIDGKEVKSPPSDLEVRIKGTSYSVVGAGKATLKADTKQKPPWTSPSPRPEQGLTLECRLPCADDAVGGALDPHLEVGRGRLDLLAVDVEGNQLPVALEFLESLGDVVGPGG